MYTKGRKRGSVRFQLKPANGAGKVSLAGDFNDWQPKAMRKQKDGSFALTLPLGAGRYQYKFWVDEHWLLDPDNVASEPNEFGTLNSVAEIEGPVGPELSKTEREAD